MMNAKTRRNPSAPLRVLLSALLFVALLFCNNATNPLNLITELRTAESVPAGSAEDVERESLKCLPDAPRPPLRQRTHTPTVAPRSISATRSSRSVPHVPVEGDRANGCGAPLRC